MSLVETTLQLWPRQSKKIIKAKGIDIKLLQKKFKNIIFPWHDTYDKYRQLFSTQIQERPLFIIVASNKTEVTKVLDLLKQYKLSIRIVGGRHSTLLQNPDVFLDMSQFINITLDKYLYVEAGLTQGQVNDYLFNLNSKYCFRANRPNHPTSLAFPGGSAASVGVAGISTVGGIGTLRRGLGLAIDAIKSITIALPPTASKNSHIVTCSKKQYKDLFWALLGGGAANFGVVIQIIYKVDKIENVIQYEIKWEWHEAEKVVKKWQETAPNHPDNFTEDLALFTDKGTTVIHLTGLYMLTKGESVKMANNCIRKELKFLDGNLRIYDPQPYSLIYKSFVEGRVYSSFSIGKTILTNKIIPITSVISLLNKAKHKPTRAYVGLQLMGGKISQVPKAATAFWKRDATVFIDIFNFWDNVLDQQYNETLNNQLFNSLYPTTGPYVYLGFPIPHLPEPLHAYYGGNKKKLQVVKRDVDPLNILAYPGSL
jgi:hypothetical protein